VQASSIVMSDILNNRSNSSNSNKFCLLEDTTTKQLHDTYTEYPLHVLGELNTLVNVEFIFIMMLFNLFIVNKLISLDYKHYLPNSRFGLLLGKLIDRDISIWSKSAVFLTILSWVNLFMCILVSKIALIFIGVRSRKLI